MASLLEGALAQTIGKAMGGLFYAATVTRLTPGGGPSHDPGEPTETEYACKAIVDDYKTKDRDGTVIQMNDRRVLVLATSLAITPKPGDLVTVRGFIYTTVSVKTDPALAVWELQVRGGSAVIVPDEVPVAFSNLDFSQAGNSGYLPVIGA